MEARVSSGFQLPNWVNPVKIARKPCSVQFLQKYGGQRLYHMPISRCPRVREGFYRFVMLKVSCSAENRQVLESESSPALFDESDTIKNKAEVVEPYLDGRCIYLVGMMGSGKTTVGRVLSEALGYSFVDCDVLIEEAAGGSTVADIFKIHGESFFRENEGYIYSEANMVENIYTKRGIGLELGNTVFAMTEVLKKLSLMHRLVISTGGGAVIRPINWRHMSKGISVWLDVPLEALARRIVAVGTGSRPLLHHGDGDPYTKTMARLSTLFEERGEAYANADVRVSFESIAAKLGYEDVFDISPTAVAIEALVQIEQLLTKEAEDHVN